MASLVRPARHQLDQENPGGGARRKGVLKTPGKGLAATQDGNLRHNQTAKEPSRVLQKSLTATDIAPRRLFADDTAAKSNGLLRDKTNKTPHPSVRRPDGKPPTDPSPAKEALQRAQLVDSPTVVATAPTPAAHLSPIPQKPDFSHIKTPSPDHAAYLRAQLAPYTPEDYTIPDKPIDPDDARRAVEWETLEERDVEYAGPTAVARDDEFAETLLTPEMLKNLAEDLRTLPMWAHQPLEELEFEEMPIEIDVPELSESSDEYVEEEETDDEAITPQAPRIVSGDVKAAHRGAPSGGRLASASAIPRRPDITDARSASALGASSSSVRAKVPAKTAFGKSIPKDDRPRPATSRPPSSSKLPVRTSGDSHTGLNRSSVSATARKLPSYMAPTAASLAKQPASPHKVPPVAPIETGEAHTNGVDEAAADKAPKKTRVVYRKKFGPLTERRAAELAAHEAIEARADAEIEAFLGKDFDPMPIPDLDDYFTM